MLLGKLQTDLGIENLLPASQVQLRNPCVVTRCPLEQRGERSGQPAL